MSNQLALLEAINNLIDRCRIGTPPSESEKHFHSISMGTEFLSFEGGSSVALYNEVIELLWKSESTIKETVSRKFIKDRVDSILKEKCVAHIHLTSDELGSTVKGLADMPVKPWDFYMALGGVKFTQSPGPVILGPFTIYDCHTNPAGLDEVVPLGFLDMMRKFGSSAFLIKVRSEARERKHAQNLAVRMFRQFDNILRAMIGLRSDRHDIGVFDLTFPVLNNVFYVGEEGYGRETTVPRPKTEVEIDSAYFKAEEIGNAAVWRMLSNPQRSELQARILTAIEWIGKGVRDPDPARAFVQFVFAFESLLTFQERAVIITPSIASQLAEFAAFILGRDYDSRLEIERLVKDLYGKRSAVAHGHPQTIDEQEADRALKFMKSLIFTLTTDLYLKQITNIKELKDWVNLQKYSTKAPSSPGENIRATEA